MTLLQMLITGMYKGFPKVFGASRSRPAANHTIDFHSHLTVLAQEAGIPIASRGDVSVTFRIGAAGSREVVALNVNEDTVALFCFSRLLLSGLDARNCWECLTNINKTLPVGSWETTRTEEGQQVFYLQFLESRARLTSEHLHTACRCLADAVSRFESVCSKHGIR